MPTYTIQRMTEEFAKVFTPEAAFAQLEYIEYLEMPGEKVCPFEKTALANIAQGCNWIVTG